MTAKRIIILVVVVAAVGVGVVQLRGMSLSTFLDGELDKVTRGDLVIPVSAPGTVEPNRLIEVKSKASGEVAKIYVVEGQMVKEGDLLVELDPVDEQRALERAQAEKTRAEASLATAENQLDEQERTLPLTTESLRYRLDDAKANLEAAQVDWEKTDSLYRREPPVASKQEWSLRKANFERAKAAVGAAETELKRALVTEKTNLVAARENVRLARAALESASKAVEEARERLADTRVFARDSGMVYSVRVKEGEIVQSGKTSLTGGTPLLYMADTSKLVVVAQVDEADIGAVRKVAPEFARPGNTRPMSARELLELSGVDVDNLDASSAPAANPLGDLINQRVRVSCEAYRTESFQGVIERILPQPQKINNVLTFDVRIVLLGSGLEKLMGLQADIEFTADRVADALRVKNEAIFSEGKETFVYVPVRKPGSNRIDERKVAVKIGRTDGVYTEIIEGLSDDTPEVFTKRPLKTQREREQEGK